ncbi:MAG TPA: FAD-binding domain-containing protein [Candidatus Tyrphobacter sp.]
MFICRFTHDLRLEDHAALAAAAEAGPVLPILVLDGELTEPLRRSPRRAAFFCAAVRALDAALRERGSRLVVRRGENTDVLVRAARESAATGVAWSARYDGLGMRSDEALRSALEEAELQAQLVHDAPAIAPEEIERSGDGTGYRAFQAYFERRRSLPIPSLDRPLLTRFASADMESEPLPEPSDFGSSEALPDISPGIAAASLERFLSSAALSYAAAQRVPAEDGTSHLSPHFSFGTLAMRTAVRATLRRLEDPFLLNEEKLSLRLFLRSLALRDFFLQLSWFHPETEHVALQERMRGFEFAQTHLAFDAWREGKTGFPLVDAGMRQLAQTGWMHPHVRAVAASFLCFDLGVDWRVGRDVWDRLLVEDDPAIATGNWQWIAGVGADLAQYPRIYNPETQQRRFDPEARYVRRWVPEIEHAPLAARQRRHEQAPMLPLYDGNAYPARVLDHAATARAFLSRYRERVS